MRFKVIIYVLAAVAIIVGIALVLGSTLPGGPLKTPMPSPSSTGSVTSSLAASSTRTPTRTLTPSRTPTLTPTSPFASIADLVSIPSGGIFDLWVSAQGELWAAAGNGLFRHISEGSYERVSSLAFGRILGTDQSGRLWAIEANGGSILAYDGGDWMIYGPQQGWDPVQPGLVQRSLAVDGDGQIWLGTGTDDLRRFDPAAGQWESLAAVDIGFTEADPNYQGHYLTEAAIAPDGSVWVADCIGWGEGFAGQGVRSFRGGAWQPLAATAGECVFDLARDGLGRMWVGAFDRILRYESITDSWGEISLPAWDRSQVVTSLALDPDGSPWIGVLRCGAAACDSSVYYFLKGGAWTPFLDPAVEFEVRPGLAFSADGSAWICDRGSLYRRSTPARVELVGTLQTGGCEIAVDGTGAVWVGAAHGPDAGLWQVRP